MQGRHRDSEKKEVVVLQITHEHTIRDSQPRCSHLFVHGLFRYRKTWYVHLPLSSVMRLIYILNVSHRSLPLLMSSRPVHGNTDDQVDPLYSVVDGGEGDRGSRGSDFRGRRGYPVVSPKSRRTRGRTPVSGVEQRGVKCR